MYASNVSADIRGILDGDLLTPRILVGAGP